MKELPPDALPYKRTPTFTEKTVPAGLLSRHTTRDGSWATIVVLDGKLRYRVVGPEPREIVLTPGRVGIVEPRVPHEVSPEGPVRFYVEFHRTAGGAREG